MDSVPFYSVSSKAEAFDIVEQVVPEHHNRVTTMDDGSIITSCSDDRNDWCEFHFTGGEAYDAFLKAVNYFFENVQFTTEADWWNSSQPVPPRSREEGETEINPHIGE